MYYLLSIITEVFGFENRKLCRALKCLIEQAYVSLKPLGYKNILVGYNYFSSSCYCFFSVFDFFCLRQWHFQTAKLQLGWLMTFFIDGKVVGNSFIWCSINVTVQDLSCVSYSWKLHSLCTIELKKSKQKWYGKLVFFNSLLNKVTVIILNPYILLLVFKLNY